MPSSLLPTQARSGLWLFGLALLVLLLALGSLNVGASSLNLFNALTSNPDDRLSRVLFASRLPRTLALILAGSALAVAGLLMQMMARNRLVEPATIGSMEAAALGMLLAAVVAPEMPMWLRFIWVSLCAAAGTLLFLGILRRIALRSALLVPLIGLVLAGVIYTASHLLAYHFDLSQALRAWSSGDFSAVLRGRYELLWIAAGLTLLACLVADRFTVIGMGRDFATNVGVNYARLMALGIVLVSLIVGSVVVTAGVIPFIGLIVPNLIRAITGDNLRRAIPLVALAGAALMLACDLLGRLLIHPFEVPSSTILAIAGSLTFIVVLLRNRNRWA